MENMTCSKVGYFYHKDGSRFYKRMCRDYYMYDPLFLKYNDRSLLKNIGVLFYVVGCFAIAITGFVISYVAFEKTILASIGVGFLAYLVAAVLNACEDFIGEITCKLHGLFTGAFIGLLIQMVGFNCNTFGEVLALENSWKVFAIYGVLCLIGYASMSSFWKSGTWNLINPSHPCSFLNKNLQNFRKSYIEKTEAKLNSQ